MIRYVRALSALCVAALLAACGGHSGSLPATPQTASQTGYIKATLYVPPVPVQSAARVSYARSQQTRHTSGVRPKYLSGNTTELDFAINSNNGNASSAGDQAAFDFTIYTSDSQNCSGSSSTGYTCSVTAPAPVGTDTYKISSYQCSVSGTSPNTSCTSLGGTLTLLGMSFATVNVVYNAVVVAAFTLSPVVSSIDWAPVSYARESTASNSLPNALWLTQPNGSNIPKYAASPSPGVYSCTYNAGSGTGNGCYEPVAQGVSIAYGEVLEARDAAGAVIVGASGGGTVYQTPVYLDQNGNAVTVSWSCKDNVIGGKSLTFDSGGGPYAGNASAPRANQYFNSPVVNPAADPDGGYTTDGNGNSVTAVGNNGVEINWDGADQPILDSPDYCTASTSNGLKTNLNFFAGLGEGGVTFNPTPAPSPTPGFGSGIYVLNQGDAPGASQTDGGTLAYFQNPQNALTNTEPNPFGPAPTSVFHLPGTGRNYVGELSVKKYVPSSGPSGGAPGTIMWAAATYIDSSNQTVPTVTKYRVSGLGTQPEPAATISGSATLLQQPWAVAVDSAGKPYVFDESCGCVYVYPALANGNVSPIRTMTNVASTSGVNITKIFIDSSGNLWASGYSPLTGAGMTAEFTGNANGAVSPILTVNYRCYDSMSLNIVCSSGGAGAQNIVLLQPSDNYTTPYYTYPTGYSDQNFGGSALPELTDASTDLGGFIYATGCGACGSANAGNSVTIFFPPTIGGSTQPYATISGSNDGIIWPQSIAVMESSGL